jgi:N-acetylglucosamine-6-phosphate deacetylase
MATLTALTDAVIFTGEAFVEGHALLIEGGNILDIVGNRKIPTDAKKISYSDTILAPGFIDAQVNGGGNVMLNNAPTAEACLAIAAAHRGFGTTHILPTCISDTPEVTRKAITAVRQVRAKDKSILGIHIEGPHLGMSARGVHKEKHIRALSDDDWPLYRREGDEIMLMTVAPDNVSPKQIEQLVHGGALVSLGHTNAGADQIHAALKAGATGFTHLFNGMNFNRGANGITGPVKAALEDRDSYCSIIADGHHVSAEMFQLALRRKPGKIFLVSDAMPPAATDDPRPFQLYGETIRVENGRLVNAEGKLAGAILTLGQAVQNGINQFGIAPDEVLRMASTYPAQFLGLDQSLGKLLPGFKADITVLSPQFAPTDIWMAAPFA